MQKIQKTYDKQGFVKTRFFEINCFGCGKEITTRSAEGMFENENGAYVFLCRKCIKAAERKMDHVGWIDDTSCTECGGEACNIL